MAKIYSQNEKYNGETATVHFKDGVGETDNKYLIDYLKSKGYKVEESDAKKVDEELEALKKEATDLEIKFNPNISKAKLLERIEEKKKLEIEEDKIEIDENDEDVFLEPEMESSIVLPEELDPYEESEMESEME